MAQGTCSANDCDRPVIARGWCTRHYQAWKKHGDPEKAGRKFGPPQTTLAATLTARVKFVDGCWVWQSYLNAKGYGIFKWRKQTAMAHRWAWIAFVGPIPDGLELDHLCRNRGCVNPAHLEPVTHQENIRRGIPATGAANAEGRKTHCPQGHPYDEANTYRAPNKNQRQCKACAVARVKRLRESA